MVGFLGAGASDDGRLTEDEATFAANSGATLSWVYTPGIRAGDVDGDGVDELLICNRNATFGVSTHNAGGVLVIEP